MAETIRRDIQLLTGLPRCIIKMIEEKINIRQRRASIREQTSHTLITDIRHSIEGSTTARIVFFQARRVKNLNLAWGARFLRVFCSLNIFRHTTKGNLPVGNRKEPLICIKRNLYAKAKIQSGRLQFEKVVNRF